MKEHKVKKISFVFFITMPINLSSCYLQSEDEDSDGFDSDDGFDDMEDSDWEDEEDSEFSNWTNDGHAWRQVDTLVLTFLWFLDDICHCLQIDR